MKAAVLEGVDQPVKILEVADPVAAPGQAVVRLRAAALNHRDVWIQRGKYAGLRFPIIVGSDGSGVVESVGPDGDRSWMGRPVIINPSLHWGADPRMQGRGFRILGLPDNGTLAERVTVPVANLAPPPGHLEPEQAAALPLAGLTAWRAVFARGGLRAGENVLVTGVGGGVALCAVQFALAAGATVYGTSGSADKLARVKELGAAGGANYRDADWREQLQQLAGGFDLIIDSAMGEGLATLIELTRPGGRIVFYGATVGNPPGFDARKVFFRQISLLGTTMGSNADFAAMLQLVASRRIVPLVDATFPLEEAERAFRRMESAAQFGKIVIRIAGQ
jgi:zinc-binding alcohol dehydrogenase/oxidoreductase